MSVRWERSNTTSFGLYTQLEDATNSFDIQTYPFTVSCWVKLSGTRSNSRANTNIFTLTDLSNLVGAEYSVETSRLSMFRYRGDTGYVFIPANRTLTFNNWTHLTFVWASNVDRRAYVNGKLVISDTFLLDISSGSMNLSFGIGFGSTTAESNGIEISDMSIYLRALSNSEIFNSSCGEVTALRPKRNIPLSPPYLSRGNRIKLQTFVGGSGGHMIGTNDSPIYTRPFSLHGTYSFRRRLFVVS